MWPVLNFILCLNGLHSELPRTIFQIRGAFNNVSARRARDILVPDFTHNIYK